MGETSLDRLAATVAALRASVEAAADRRLGEWAAGTERQAFKASAHNLAAHLALRRQDLRPLQIELMSLGLSSLDRRDGRALANLDAVVWALDRLRGERQSQPVPPERFFHGQTTLGRNTEDVFGPRPAPRRVRIIVTLPSEAADDPALAVALAQAGADVCRINCAHDDPATWTRMANHVRSAAAETGRQMRLLMDLAGPKVRTGRVRHPDDQKRLGAGDSLLLHHPDHQPAGGFAAATQVPAVLDQLAAGHRVFIDDGKVATVVDRVTAEGVLLRVTRVGPKGWKPKAEKGLNFPDTPLDVPALGEKDLADLPHVLGLADLVGFSFVQDAPDIQALQAAMAALRPADWQTVPLVAKIETPRAVAALPAIIVAAAGRQPMAVMIARGDLAVEIGFERLAEMQEELMWLCEAAHVPVIWATQVLEQLVKKGLPSRGEMTDAAMAVRAEAVTLNKGPYVVDGVTALDQLLTRMADHQDKKTPKLRALASW
jgi:pyruvate kinase